MLSAGPDVLRLTPPLVVSPTRSSQALGSRGGAPREPPRAAERDSSARPADQALSTQAELVQALRNEGHDVVQTTVSRDVTELGLVKVRAPSGRLIYAAPGTGDADRLRAIGAALRRYATGVEAASGGLVIVTTPSGYASALAQAIDEGSHPAIAGTLAGDNTIFIAAKTGSRPPTCDPSSRRTLTDGAAE